VTALTGQKYWFHRHPKFTLSLFALFGCVAASILMELTARVLFPGWAPATEERVKFWTYDELLGWAHAPSQRGRFNHPDFSVEVVINSQGMRDNEYSMERTGKRRMLVLGDSFAWGFGVEHHERFSEILENAHPDWEIINASVSGYGTDQEFLLLKERGIAFKPDVVLLLFYENDFASNIHTQEHWYFKPLFVIENGQLKLQNVPVPKATINQRLRRFFLGRTYLGPSLYSGKDAFLRLFRSLVGGKTGDRDTDSGDKQRMHNVTYHLIKGMVDVCKKNGSVLVLVSVPMSAEKRRFLQGIAARETIPYLPLDSHFESSVTRVVFPHDPHWNTKGHELAANVIDAFLLELGVFDASELSLPIDIVSTVDRAKPQRSPHFVM